MWSMTVGAVGVNSRRVCFGALLRGGRGSVIVMIFGDWLIVIIIATLSFILLVVMFVIIIVEIVIVTHSSFYSNYFAHLIVDAIPLTQPSSKQSSISSIHSIAIVFVPP